MQDLRAVNKQRRRRQILLAAHDLVGREGIQALTMRVLADEAQVSVPTIYALVGGRDLRAERVATPRAAVALRRAGGHRHAGALGELVVDTLPVVGAVWLMVTALTVSV